MRRRIYAVVLALIVTAAGVVNCAGRQAQTTTPTVPDTPAGRRLSALLRALDAGDADTLRRFVAENIDKATSARLPAAGAESFLARLYGETRGLDLYRVEQSADYEITALARARATEDWFLIRVQVAAEPPHGIVRPNVQRVPPPADVGPRRKMSDPEIARSLDDYLKQAVAAGTFSGAVLVARDGSPIFERAYGTANFATNSPNKTDTKFNLGSMNKMFTAVAVAQLAERGKLSFGDTVGKYLKDYPDRRVAERVTVHHLLTHTSGLGTYFNERYWSSPRDKYKQVSDYFPLFTGDPLAFEPGERFRYSNAGYIILGAIIEKASGENYYDYVRGHIFRPAGMTDTGFYWPDRSVQNLAVGYTSQGQGGGPGPGGRRDNSGSREFRGGPAGGGYSTVTDLLRFDIALRNHKLLSPQYTELVTGGKVEAGTPGVRYGYGFMEERVNGKRIVGHSGGSDGINSQLDMYMEGGYTVAVMSNYDPPAAQRVALKLREMLTRE